MSIMKVTLLGLQHYLHNLDDDLFKNLTLPEGIDKDTLKDNILLRGSDFEVLYSDPYFVQDAIGLWSRKWQRTFEKWVEALSLEYNPLENYDRIEDWTDQNYHTSSTSARRDSGNTRTFNNEDKQTLNTENKRTVDLTNVEETEVSAFDSSNYQPSQKVTSDQDGTDTMSNTGTDTMNHTGTIKDEYGEGSSGQENGNSTNTHGGRIHGNIGVTSSVQLLTEQLQISEWNMYEHITDLFLSEFVIPIYS